MDSGYSGTANLEVMACAVNYNEFLLDLLRRHARPGDRMLDFGAGVGTFARRLRDEGFDVSCVEPDPGQRAAVTQEGIRCEPGLDSYPAASFDFVYSLNVLEHIEDDLAALNALRLRLRAGGRLFVYVPALPFLFSSMDRQVGHFRRYTAATLRAVLQAARFRVERCRYADSLGVPATLLYKLGGDRGGAINERALIAYDRVAFPVSRLLDFALGSVGGKNVWAIADCAQGNDR